MSKADSLDCYQHRIMQDTMAFQSVIQVWDKPFVRILKHDNLGRAYYYVGRNYEDYYQDYTSAASCYIRSDRFHMADPIMRGRVLSCMENMCVNSNEYDFALDLSHKALECYLQSGDSMMIVHGLLNLAQVYSLLQKNNNVDSVLSSVESFSPDSAALVRYYIQKGYSSYDAKQYDSAIDFFTQSLNVSGCHIDEEYAYHMLLKSHYRLQRLDSAAYYANLLLQYSSPFILFDAYYILMEDARLCDNAEAVAKYAHLRADIQQDMKSKSNTRTRGTQMIIQYYEETRDNMDRIITVIIVVFLLIGILSLLVNNYRHRLTRTRQELLNREQTIKEMEMMNIQRIEAKRNAIDSSITRYHSVFAFDSKIWYNDQLLCAKADECLFNLYTRLHQQYKIDAQDLKICILTLYGASRTDVANCINRAVSSVPKLRTNLAKKFGITYPQLMTFLLDYMAS